MAKIRYIGKKERKTTTLVPVVWNGHGDVQEVPDAAVGKLLVHADSFELVGDATPAAPETTSTAAVNEMSEADAKPPMANLDTMDKTALRDYAQRHFGHGFHPNTGEAKMRQTIVGLMNRG